MIYLRRIFSMSFKRSGDEYTFHIGWFWIAVFALFWAKVFGWL